MTIGVETNNEFLIIKTSPIVRVFKKQPLNNLIIWLKRQNGFKIKEIPI
jgi:hypothetical protein